MTNSRSIKLSDEIFFDVEFDAEAPERETGYGGSFEIIAVTYNHTPVKGKPVSCDITALVFEFADLFSWIEEYARPKDIDDITDRITDQRIDLFREMRIFDPNNFK